MNHGSLWVKLVTMALVPMIAMASDADHIQDFCVRDPASGIINGFVCKPANKVSVNDFKFDGLMKPGNTNNADNAVITPASVVQFPVLNALGISAGRIDFAKGGIIPPHAHPRATEVMYVIKGELYVGFVTTSKVLLATVLKAGELFVSPRGLVHFHLNVGEGPALAFVCANGQNPGVQELAPALFTPNVSSEVLAKAFRINQETVDMIQKEFGV